MLKSKFIKREQAIYSQIKIKDIYINKNFEIDNIKDYDNESIMLRGIIDAYFEEDDNIILIDYKTDFVNDENKEDVIKRYKKQINLYSEVLEELTGKKVKEKWIYLFGIDEGILM